MPRVEAAGVTPLEGRALTADGRGVGGSLLGAGPAAR